MVRPTDHRRHGPWSVVLPALVLLALAGVACAPAGETGADGPAVRFEDDAESPAYGSFEVVGLEPGLLAALARARPGAATWGEAFSIHTVGEDGRPAELAVLGSYELADGRLRFRPRFPSSPGVVYHARLDVARLRSLAGVGAAAGDDAGTIETVFALPPPAAPPSTRVAAVYPSGDAVPANLLKLYLHFSAPMARGVAFDHLRLVDETGEEVPVFLGRELWDPPARRLTLFLDPGRIKRGLRPHDELGAPLLAGRRYTLRVDPAWPDARGLPLAASFAKTFTVTVADRRVPRVADWRVELPAAGGRAPLELVFPEPLDHALLGRLLTVRDAAGEAVPGRVEIADAETRWRFYPARPWVAGDHRLEVGEILEDLAGNSLRKLFDVDRAAGEEEGVTAERIALPFRIPPPASAGDP